MRRLAVIFADQLCHHLSSIKALDKSTDHILMMEVAHEATVVPHHPKKIAFLFSAMRHFEEELRRFGFVVHYLPLQKTQITFTKTLENFLKKHRFDQIVVTHPGEYRVLQEVQSWPNVHLLEDNRFFCSMGEFQAFRKGKKKVVMESFYRWLRKKTGLLMEGNQPTGGQWNFDRENRKKIKEPLQFKGPLQFSPDKITSSVIELVREKFGSHFGDITPFWFATTRKEALAALHYFIEHSLPFFGDYQDAMQDGEPFLFHSVLSQYLNCGLLSPQEVCTLAEKSYFHKKAPLNAVEGFIRQIVGWREFVRLIYWSEMPEYAKKNTFQAKRKLPSFYWDGATDMQCMQQVLLQTKQEAQSHHIQRLMVTGNYALLADIDPKEVCAWYLAVYADAYEWVELPNTLGMTLYGDDGILATKPYAASGKYIQRMSNFCKKCTYNPNKRTGKNACPFNILYWDFLLRHQEKLEKNPRMALVYKNVKKMSKDEIQTIQHQAQKWLTRKASK